MVINWYGEGCFKIQTGGLTLLTDPLDSTTGLTPSRGKNNIVIKTLTACPLQNNIKEENTDNLILGGGEYEIQELTIQGFSIQRESSEKFFKTVYKVTAEGITLAFLGHLSEELSPDALEGFRSSDIVFIPAGGKPFINQETAAKLLKQLSPKIVVASFFKIPKLKRKTSDWKSLADEMDQKPEALEKLTIRKKELTEQKGTKLVVLKL